jgi:hypothetical protein
MLIPRNGFWEVLLTHRFFNGTRLGRGSPSDQRTVISDWETALSNYPAVFVHLRGARDPWLNVRDNNLRDQLLLLECFKEQIYWRQYIDEFWTVGSRNFALLGQHHRVIHIRVVNRRHGFLLPAKRTGIDPLNYRWRQISPQRSGFIISIFDEYLPWERQS